MALVPGSLVGKLEGARAYVALSFDGRRLRAYVCDGDGKRVATIATWLKGRWDGHSPVTLRREGVELRVEQVHGDGRFTGSVTAFSGPHPFTVEPATGPAGLYDGSDGPRNRAGARATWIVLADRSVRGAMVPPRPPRRVCRDVTVVLADGTTAERVTC